MKCSLSPDIAQSALKYIWCVGLLAVTRYLIFLRQFKPCMKMDGEFSP